jgi:hypothetical protein
VGEQDATIPPRSVAQVAKRYGGEFRKLPGHAHELVADPGWEEVAAMIAAWAQRLPSRYAPLQEGAPGSVA